MCYGYKFTIFGLKFMLWNFYAQKITFSVKWTVYSIEFSSKGYKQEHCKIFSILFFKNAYCKNKIRVKYYNFYSENEKEILYFFFNYLNCEINRISFDFLYYNLIE